MDSKFKVTFLETHQSLITSRKTICIGTSLVNDIRIHLPTIKEIHVEIDLVNKTIIAHGSDVKINNVNLETRKEIPFTLEDRISIKGRELTIEEVKEDEENDNINVYPVYKQDANSSFFFSDILSSQESSNEVETKETASADLNTEESESIGEKVLKDEKNVIDEKIKDRLEINPKHLDTHLKAEHKPPVDLKEAVIEKKIIDDLLAVNHKKQELIDEVKRDVVDELKEDVLKEVQDIVKNPEIKEKLVDDIKKDVYSDQLLNKKILEKNSENIFIEQNTTVSKEFNKGNLHEDSGNLSKIEDSSKIIKKVKVSLPKADFVKDLKDDQFNEGIDQSIKKDTKEIQVGKEKVDEFERSLNENRNLSSIEKIEINFKDSANREDIKELKKVKIGLARNEDIKGFKEKNIDLARNEDIKGFKEQRKDIVLKDNEEMGLARNEDIGEFKEQKKDLARNEDIGGFKEQKKDLARNEDIGEFKEQKKDLARNEDIGEFKEQKKDLARNEDIGGFKEQKKDLARNEDIGEFKEQKKDLARNEDIRGFKEKRKDIEIQKDAKLDILKINKSEIMEKNRIDVDLLKESNFTEQLSSELFFNKNKELNNSMNMSTEGINQTSSKELTTSIFNINDGIDTQVNQSNINLNEISKTEMIKSPRVIIYNEPIKNKNKIKNKKIKLPSPSMETTNDNSNVHVEEKTEEIVNPVENKDIQENVEETVKHEETQEVKDETVKRGRGRPKKGDTTPRKVKDEKKGPRGRPRKLDGEKKEKDDTPKKRGRPPMTEAEKEEAKKKKAKSSDVPLTTTLLEPKQDIKEVEQSENTPSETKEVATNGVIQDN